MFVLRGKKNSFLKMHFFDVRAGNARVIQKMLFFGRAGNVQIQSSLYIGNVFVQIIK